MIWNNGSSRFRKQALRQARGLRRQCLLRIPGGTMRFIALAVLPLLLALASCSTTEYDLVETSSISPKFQDSDPQNFGRITPQHHPIHGVDVSKWNGDIDWVTARDSGVSFVFIKATEGKDRIDNKFEENWRGAKAAKMPYAPYHF